MGRVTGQVERLREEFLGGDWGRSVGSAFQKEETARAVVGPACAWSSGSTGLGRGGGEWGAGLDLRLG